MRVHLSGIDIDTFRPFLSSNDSIETAFATGQLQDIDGTIINVKTPLTVSEAEQLHALMQSIEARLADRYFHTS